MRLTVWCLLILPLAATTRADAMRQEGAMPGLRVYQISLEAAKNTSDDLYVAVIDPARMRARLLNQPQRIAPDHDAPSSPTVAGLAQRTGSAAALNGGYFTDSYAPDGLLRVNGRELSPLSAKAVLSGVLEIDATGRVALTPRTSYKGGGISAVQSGPFLVDPGGRHGINNRKGPETERSVVALTRRGEVLLVATPPLTLAACADLLLHLHETLPIAPVERALNMDGGPSTGFYARLPRKTFAVHERGPVRDVIAFAPRGP